MENNTMSVMEQFSSKQKHQRFNENDCCYRQQKQEKYGFHEIRLDGCHWIEVCVKITKKRRVVGEKHRKA